MWLRGQVQGQAGGKPPTTNGPFETSPGPAKKDRPRGRLTQDVAEPCRVSASNSTRREPAQTIPANSGITAVTVGGDMASLNALNRTNPSLPTPVKIQALDRQGYQQDLQDRLVRGFQWGFPIPSMLKNNPQKGAYVNHKSVQANIHTVKQNIDKEVLLGRMAGHFVSPPLKNFVTSPLGLVPKKEAGQFRLIHDLSFPRGHSVNSNIDTYFATVQYENLDHCVDIIQKLGPDTLMAKADIQEAFRNVPIHPKDYKFLGFMFENKYYYDKCLPFGCSSSCQTFELLSTALQWICKNNITSHWDHGSHWGGICVGRGSRSGLSNLALSSCNREIRSGITLSLPAMCCALNCIL